MTDSEAPAKRIALLGATGAVGRIFLRLALDEGHSVKALVRSAGKLESFASPRLEVLEGDALDPEVVGQLVDGADVVVSCLGNVQRSVLIMERSAANILAAARARPAPPRCLFISSIGCGGSSWLVKAMLLLIVGRKGFKDYEGADALFLAAQDVPWMLVRPAVLTNKPGTGRYRVFAGSAAYPSPVPRADVARFLLDAVASDEWDGGRGVQLAAR